MGTLSFVDYRERCRRAALMIRLRRIVQLAPKRRGG